MVSTVAKSFPKFIAAARKGAKVALGTVIISRFHCAMR